MSMLKYRLLEKNEEGMYRILALRDIPGIGVKKGDLGGLVGNERNLSQEGDCWIRWDALVGRFAEVSGNAEVYGNAMVYGNAKVSGNAKVRDDALVYGNAKVRGDALVCGNAIVCNDAMVSGKAIVCDYAKVYDFARVYGAVIISECARVYGHACVHGLSVFHRHCNVCGCSEICGDAVVETIKDYIVFKNWWSSGRYFTWTRSNNRWNVGCFYGSGKKLIEKAEKDSELSGREYARVVRYVEQIRKVIGKEEGKSE